MKINKYVNSMRFSEQENENKIFYKNELFSVFRIVLIATII